MLLFSYFNNKPILLIMDNIIKFYYGINIIDIFKKDNKYFFQYDNHDYCFMEYDRDKNDLKSIINICMELKRKNIITNEFVLNKFHSYITPVNLKLFVLLKENVTAHIIGFNDILYFQNNTYNLLSNFAYNRDYISLWKRKIDFYEKKLASTNKKNRLIDKSLDYFIGLGENAITYLVNTDNKVDNIVVAHRRIFEDLSSFDFYNPLNYILDNRARDLADYVIKLFFYKKVNSDIILSILSHISFNRNEYIIFLSRLLFPTYYFDLIDKILLSNEDEEILKIVINKTDDYLLLLKRIFYYINYNIGVNIPTIEWIIKKT